MSLDPRHKSHTLVDGPGRAPARSLFQVRRIQRRRPPQASCHGRALVDRHHALQLQPARTRPARDGRRPRSRRHTDGSQHDLHQRRHLHGHRGHEGLARQPRSHHRLHRTGGHRLLVRCRRHHRRLRQDHPGRARWRSPASTSPGSCSTAARSPRAVSRAATSPSRTSSKASASMPPAHLRTKSSTAIEDAACPGAGACGAQYTANTMAMVLEFMGLSPMGSGTVGADRPAARTTSAVRRGRARDGRPRARCPLPRDILTREAIENGIVGAAATGGSTNVVLHLLAIAREAGVQSSRSMTSTGSARPRP